MTNQTWRSVKKNINSEDFCTVAQKHRAKGIFHSLYSSSAWYAALVPDNTGVQWAIVQQTSQGPLLHAHGVDETAQTALVHTQDIAATSLYIASVLPSFPTLCRQVSLPPLRPKEIETALIDTLEQTLSVGVEESAVAYEVVRNSDGSLNILAYLARQSAISEHLDQLQSFSIDPEWIIPKAPCLAAFIAHFAFSSWHYVIDIGADETTVVLIFNGKVVESRSLVGGSEIFAHLGAPSQESDEHLRRILQHLAEAVFAYRERYGIGAEAGLTVTGDVLSYPMASSIVAEFVQAPLSPLHESSETISLLQCATAIGAAFVAQQPNASLIPNFRIGPFQFPHPFLHWKRPLTSLMLGCLTVASMIAWYGHSRSEMVIDAMRSDWKKITQTNHTTPDEVNRQTENLLPDIHINEKASPEQMIAQGKWVLSSIERNALYPLQPHIPRVTDLISWLTLQIDEIAQATPDSTEKIEIQSLQYQMVKRPTKAHPKERYQVRVDLEFSTPSVAMARAFHDHLVSNNTFIDTPSEIKWTPSNGKYRAVFFLKDTTFYPPQES